MDSASVGNSVVDSILLDRYPDIAFQLNFTAFTPFVLCTNPDQSWNAVKDDAFLHTENPAREIERFLMGRNLGELDIFYLYGIGLGYHYAALKSWLEERRDRVLIIFEEDLGVIEAFLSCAYAEEILVHPQVHLRFAQTPKAISALIRECVATFLSDRVEIAAIASYEKKRRFRSLQMQLYRFTAVSHALMTEAIYPHKLLSNLIRNILKWPGSFFANSLKKQFHGVPAIICGAGPSLAKTFNELKQINDRALIIAGGSTIAALSNQGIIPHIGLAFDPNAEEFDRLKAASSYEMPLIYGSRLESHVFNTCNGPRGYVLSDTGGPCETHFEKAMGLETDPVGPELGVEAFSVTTFSIALAVEMGCDPIILNGIDLAYTGMQRYAHGVLPSSKIYFDEEKKTKKASERLIRRKDIFGNPAHTLVKWVMESECIGAYAKKNPHCRFLNATQGGLGFPGIPNLSLQEIMNTALLAPLDLNAMLHTLFQNDMIKVSQEDIFKEIEQVYLSLGRIERISEHILAEIDRVKLNPAIPWPTGKMTILEIDFQEEKAFGCLFPILGPALDRLFNRTHYLSPLLSELDKRRIQLECQKAKWNQFKERIHYQMDFFLTVLTSSPFLMEGDSYGVQLETN